MKKWNMIFDVDRCTNCRNCFISVLDEYAENEHKGYSAPAPRKGMHLFRIDTYEQGSDQDLNITYVPKSCNNCANAPCVAASKDGAVYQRADGIVIIDPEKSKGRKEIVNTCPYGHIHWNEEQGLPQIWTFDAHLLDNGWKQPRMVDACPTLAIEAVKCTDAEMNSRVNSDGLRTLKPQLGTKPRIYYKNLDQIFESFLVGSVLTRIDQRLEALEGVEVKLEQDGDVIASATTDFFGDFKFEGLSRDVANYSVTASPPDYNSQTRDLVHSDSERMTPFVFVRN